MRNKLEKFMMQMTGQSEVAHFLLNLGRRESSQLSQAGGHWTPVKLRFLNKSICPRLSPEDHENVTYPLEKTGAEKEGQKRLCANLLNALPVISLKM